MKTEVVHHVDTDQEKNLFVSQSTFLGVEMSDQNSVIRDKNLTKKQCDSRHNLASKHKNHAQKCLKFKVSPIWCTKHIILTE